VTITALIDKYDNYELVRNEIAAILLAETSSQQALATAAGKDPTLWAFDVYLERFNPWERYINDRTEKTPIVNVWYDSDTTDLGASELISRQKHDGIFHIDCYGRGIARSDGGAGHVPGDRDAVLEAQRVTRLVRNIIMASTYTYLNMRGVVWRRYVQNRMIFQPSDNQRPVQQVMAGRLTLAVEYNETSPQYEGDTLELISAEVSRADDGKVYFTAEYDVT
jgi:hypothetical protein